MPSTTSSLVSIDLASSTVMVPSLPTLSMASAMISPIVRSQLAETVATCAISVRSLTFLGIFELDFLGHGHTILGDRRAPEFLVEDDVAATRSEGRFYSAREFLDAAE